MIILRNDNDFFSVLIAIVFGSVMTVVTDYRLRLDHKKNRKRDSQKECPIYKKIFCSFVLAVVAYVVYIIFESTITNSYPVFWKEAKMMLLVIVLIFAIYPLVNKYMK